ncbi:hypothetical protein B296_00021358, partial [Ensete ventricosum]
ERLWDRAGVGVGEAGRTSATRGCGASTSGGIPRSGAIGDSIYGGAVGGADCAWIWLVRPRKASVVTMSGVGFDEGEGNPGSVIILQKRLGVGTAAVASSVGQGWSGSVRCSIPESPNGRYDDMGPPSSAKNVRGEFGACLVDAFRLRGLWSKHCWFGPVCAARPRSSWYEIGARLDEW